MKIQAFRDRFLTKLSEEKAQSWSFLRGIIAGAILVVLFLSWFIESDYAPSEIRRAHQISVMMGQLDPESKERVGGALEKFADVLALVEQQHVTEYLKPVVVTAMLNGALKAVDPFSGYIEEDVSDPLLSGADIDHRKQIGFLMSSHDGAYQIEAVAPDGPAEKAGLLPGDIVVRIGDRFVGNDSPMIVHSEILKELKNDNLNYLDLGIKRGPNSTFLTISVFPEDINPISVYDLGVQSGVLHIYVLRFYPGTADEVDQLVSRAIAEHDIHGVIIDLRNNGGGLTSEAQALSGLFLDRGTLLYEMSGRAIGVERIFTQASPKFSRLDVSIIVNGRSASSSEIVAAAFQAHGRGKIIGWPTYGKGTVQRMFPVDGGAIKITVAEYKDGGLRKIDSVGVLPDVLIANVDPRVRPSRFEQDPARFAARREVGLALSTSETDQ